MWYKKYRHASLLLFIVVGSQNDNYISIQWTILKSQNESVSLPQEFIDVFYVPACSCDKSN